MHFSLVTPSQKCRSVGAIAQKTARCTFVWREAAGTSSVWAGEPVARVLLAPDKNFVIRNPLSAHGFLRMPALAGRRPRQVCGGRDQRPMVSHGLLSAFSPPIGRYNRARDRADTALPRHCNPAKACRSFRVTSHVREFSLGELRRKVQPALRSATILRVVVRKVLPMLRRGHA